MVLNTKKPVTPSQRQLVQLSRKNLKKKLENALEVTNIRKT